MSSLVSTTTPLLAAGTYTSASFLIPDAVSLKGSVFADQAGTLYIDQGGDDTNWDIVTTINVPGGGNGIAINVEVVSQFFRVRYVNGGTPQSTFRLFVDPRDISGVLLGKPVPPSAGGQYVVLFKDSSHGWQYVNRYNGTDQIAALRSAAVDRNRGGVYAAFDVNDAIVGIETLSTTADYEPTAF